MYIYEKKSLKMTSLNVVFDAGSLYEAEGKKGTMHLMEHLACKTFEDMRSLFTAKGITWNAYTSDEKVVFWLQGLDSQLTPEIKREYVTKLLGGLEGMSRESFENEKKTVIEEYNDVFNDPERGVLENFMREKFDYFGPIGRRADIEAFTYEDALKTKKEVFTKPVRIIEVGPTKTDFSDIEYNEERAEYKELKYKKKYDNDKENVPESDKTLVVAYSKKLVKKSEFTPMTIALSMLGKGLESPLYQEIREKRGLSYYSRACVDTFIDKSLPTMFAYTVKERGDELVDVYKDFISNVDKYLTKERYEEIVSMFTIAKEKRKIFRFENVDDLVRKNEVQLAKNVAKVPFEKVVEVAKKYINEKNMLIAKL